MTAPAVIRLGQARLTAGLDRYPRLDLAAHREVFGRAPDLTAAQLIALCEAVDLRGRGGAAFPFARKMRAVRARNRRPVVVVNGTEGEPGSAKDKTLLARSPYLVLDGAMLAARALRARDVVVAVTADGPHLRSVADAAAADRAYAGVRVVSVPGRFVSGESSALVRALSGGAALPSGTRSRAADSGVRGHPTLLSNAETFAQLAVLARVGAGEFAAVGSPAEPGTVLLTVGGSVAHPAVVETPSGVPLGHVLEVCGARQPHGVLVGGYHGLWLSAGVARGIAVSRAGLAAGGGTLGAGVVLVLGEETCPVGEVSRVASYLATQSAGQCGPCRQGLPAIASSLAAITAGAGGLDELESVRRGAGRVRGRGACHHPDGTANFVVSALDVFARDLAEHLFRGTCGRPVAGLLPLDQASGPELAVDWTRCRGHGLCASIAPELIRLDEHGYPVLLAAPVPFWLRRDAQQAASMCPALALTISSPATTTSRLRRAQPPKPPAALPGASPRRPVPDALNGEPPTLTGEPPTLTGRALQRAELAAASAWLRELGGQSLTGD